METIALTIDGKKITCPAGSSLLEAADQNGIKIPRLCYHPDLKPYGACRMCLVENESGRLLAACVTPAATGMEIQTATPRIIKHRRNIVRLMIAEHPESCIVCAKGNRCQLRQAAANLGVGETDLYPMPNYKSFEEANPFMIRDLSKCILCGKCIRADHELVEIGAIDYNMRGFHSRPATVHEQSLEQSNCTFCGTCLSLCPTGALSAKNMQFAGSPAEEKDSICGFCGVGCRLTMGSFDNRIVEVNPAHDSESVNGATLCVRGHFAHDYLNSSSRLVSPLMRPEKEEHRELVPISWDEALDRVATRLKDIKDTYGPQSIGFMGSSKCTLEENYLFQKLARVCMGTNNVDNGSHAYGHYHTRILDEKTNGGYRLSHLAELKNADVIFVLGADPSHSVPVVAYYLKRAARSGTPMIVADPRRTELVNFSRLWLPVDPAGDLALINTLSALLLEKGSADQSFIDRCTEGFSAFKLELTGINLDDNGPKTGLEPAAIKSAADLLSGKKIAFVIGHGILQRKHAANTLAAVLNLSLMSGSLGSGRGGIYIVAKENNQQGAMDMGATPDLLPGRQPFDSKDSKRIWEQNWHTKLSPDGGLNMSEMIRAAENGTLKALYILGENPLAALPQHAQVKRALEKLDFLVVQDILKSETAAMAHVALAGAAMAEKEGAFTNLEGRVQSFTPVVAPPGKALADWKILNQLQARLGGTEPFDTIASIRDEIRRYVPMYAALNGHNEAWIKPAAQKAAFNIQGADERIAFCPVVSERVTPPDKNYPFTAIVGTRRFQLGSGTRTRASERIQEFGSAGQLEISPADAAALDCNDGDSAVVRSPWGEIQRTLRISTDLRPGHIFVPTGANGNDAMDLFKLADETEWKSCAVQIEKA